MLKLSVRGLPRSMTEDGLIELFSRFGRVHELKLSKDLFSGECRGFAEVQMEGHEARAAIDALDGSNIEGAHLRVQRFQARGRGRRR